MVTSLGYFIGRGITFFIKVIPNHGVLMQIYKGHFYPKNKFQENTEKKWRNIKDCRDIIVSLNIEMFEKPWKSIKVTQFHSTMLEHHSDVTVPLSFLTWYIITIVNIKFVISIMRGVCQACPHHIHQANQALLAMPFSWI